MTKLSILIVDDHDAVRSSIRSMIQSKRGWEICGEACNGLEAIERTTVLKPDLVLMDLSMPQLGGLEATKVIRRGIPTTKVLVISQNDPAISSRQALAAGAWGYVSKATLGTDLLPAIDRFSRESGFSEHSDPS